MCLNSPWIVHFSKINSQFLFIIKSSEKQLLKVQSINLTGNTNAYRGVVYNGFVFDEINVRGFYIEELNIGYIYNGNHSISIGSIFGDLCIKTNIKYFKSCTFKKEFYNYKILYNKIITDNGEIEITNWRFAALLKIIQLTYKKIN